MNINDLIYEIFCQLGFEVDQNTNTVTYQDSRMPVLYNDKVVKFSYNGPLFINSDSEIWFDPINNKNLCDKLFQVYNYILMTTENIRNINSQVVISEDNSKYALFAVYIINGEKVEKISRYYKNASLCFLDLILDGMYDLSCFDM